MPRRTFGPAGTENGERISGYAPFGGELAAFFDGKRLRAGLDAGTRRRHGSLWESMTEFTEDERLPYWTELWPSSLVLADWLYQRRESLRGQPCLISDAGSA